VAVAGEAKVEAQGGEVVILSEKVQCARQAKAQLVAIQRQAFPLLDQSLNTPLYGTVKTIPWCGQPQSSTGKTLLQQKRW
jgi:hypothetical protein